MPSKFNHVWERIREIENELNKLKVMYFEHYSQQVATSGDIPLKSHNQNIRDETESGSADTLICSNCKKNLRGKDSCKCSCPDVECRESTNRVIDILDRYIQENKEACEISDEVKRSLFGKQLEKIKKEILELKQENKSKDLKINIGYVDLTQYRNQDNNAPFTAKIIF